MSEARLGPYRLLRKLSEGGMGAVYEGFHDAIERHVAIKVLRPELVNNPDFVTRFLNEAKAANRIGHPSIVQIFDSGRLTDGTSYIVMELLSGDTLGARLRKQGGRLPLLFALQAIGQIANALSSAHAKNIIHRDLKPDNIMLVHDPAVPGGERVKLLDFGIAKLRDPNLRKNITKGDSLLGTPAYMSPEQCRGGVEVSDRSDVYSLGVILYRVLAGRPPFLAKGGGELLGMHQFQTPAPLREVADYLPQTVVALIEEMMRKDPTLRPSMKDVEQRLGVLQTELSGFVQPTFPERKLASDWVEQEDGDPDEDDDEDDDEHEAATISASSSDAEAPLDVVFAPVETSNTPSSPDSSVPSRPMGLDESGPLGNPSTMNLSASENRSPKSHLYEPRRMLRWALLFGGLVVAFFAMRMLGKNEPTSAGQKAHSLPSIVQPNEKPDVPPRSRVKWHIQTSPVRADILRVSDGALLGKTPWQSEQIAGSGTQELRLVAPGFADKLVVLDSSRDEQKEIQLESTAASTPKESGTKTETPLGKTPQKALKDDAHKKKKKRQIEIEE